jgi:hypothetical protein
LRELMEIEARSKIIELKKAKIAKQIKAEEEAANQAKEQVLLSSIAHILSSSSSFFFLLNF